MDNSENQQLKHLGLSSHKDHVALASRRIEKGGSYGLDDCLTHNEDEPLIEFYAWYFHQWCFVSRYYRETLTGEGDWSQGDSREGSGLCLCGSQDISCSADQVRQACE
jgi:hypothetical protein